tara:strand:+ start:348 stop:770 length:423 start_codon:yes stop_codon:yes gene_type:complete
MKLTNKQLKQIIKEELAQVLKESELQKLLGLGHKYSTEELYAQIWGQIKQRGLDSISLEEKEMMEQAIRNRMVKEQIGEEHFMYEQLSLLLNAFDSDRRRRLAYRQHTSDERRTQSKSFDDKGVSPYSDERPWQIRKQRS